MHLSEEAKGKKQKWKYRRHDTDVGEKQQGQHFTSSCEEGRRVGVRGEGGSENHI